jgi:uncharacterized protein
MSRETAESCGGTRADRTDRGGAQASHFVGKRTRDEWALGLRRRTPAPVHGMTRRIWRPAQDFDGIVRIAPAWPVVSAVDAAAKSRAGPQVLPDQRGSRPRDNVRAVGTVRVGEFEWDEAKAHSNVRKHGVTFEEAMTVFLDELAVPFEEGRHSDRLVLIGESQLGRTVLVVFTERIANGTIRIIGARRATKRERRAYAEGD